MSLSALEPLSPSQNQQIPPSPVRLRTPTPHPPPHTFIAVPDSIEVDIVAVVTEEHKAEPRVERVDGNNEQNAYDPALLVWTRVVP